MTVVTILNGLLIAALLSYMSLDAAAAEISIALEGSEQVAICKAGDSRCVRKGDQILVRAEHQTINRRT